MTPQPHRGKRACGSQYPTTCPSTATMTSSSFLWVTLAVSLLADPGSACSSPHPCCVLGALSLAWRLTVSSLGLLTFPPQPSGATNCTHCPLTAEPSLRPHFPIGLLSQAHLSPLIPDKFRTPTWTPCPSPNLRCAHPMLYSEAVLCAQRKHPQLELHLFCHFLWRQARCPEVALNKSACGGQTVV